MFRKNFVKESGKYISSVLVLILMISMIPMATTAATGGAPLVNNLEVQAEIDLAPPPATYDPPVNNFGMMGVGLIGVAGPNGVIYVTQVDITHTGTGATSDITQVRIYNDTNANNVFNPGVDLQVGSTTTWTAGVASVTTTSLNPTKAVLLYFWVTYDFAAAASGTHGCEITLAADITADKPVSFNLITAPPNSSMVPRVSLPPLDFTVDWVNTYNTTAQTKQFYSGETVTIRGNVSHTWGQANIVSANITIKSPSGTDVVTNVSMVKLPTPQGPNYRVFQYNHNLLIPSQRGRYWAWVFVDGLGLGGLPIFNLSKNDFFVLNKPPEILGPIPNQDKLEDETWNLGLSLYKTDLEDSGPALVWNVTSVNSPLQSIDILGDTLTFNLIPEASGDDEVTLILEDSDLAQDSTTFWVNITAVDDPPVIAPIPHQLKGEDDPDWSLDLSTFKSDPEDPPGVLTWDVYDVDISKYSVNVNGDSLDFSLVPDANGDDMMYVNLTDSTNHVTEQGVWVNITPVNDAPDWAAIPNVVVTSNITQDALTLRDYLSDIDTQPHNLVIGMVSNSNSDNINVTIDPNDKVDVELLTANYSGFAVINVSAYDGMDYAYGKFSVISIIGEVMADLRSPTDNSTVTTLTPKLLWSPVVPSGFATLEVVFDVYLDTNVTNVTTLNASALVSAAQTEESYTPSQPLIDQSDYYWTVIPKLIDSEGFTVFVGYCQDGVWNFTVDIFAPNTPPNVLLKSPANQTAVNSTTVELIWEAFDANGDWPLFYDIYLGPDPSDMAKILDKGPLSETNFTVEGLQEDGIFYWTVLPYDGVLSGVCLDGIWEFAINAENQPPIATLQAPLDGSQTGLTPELRWTSVDSDPFDNINYSIYLSETESDVTQYEPSALLRKDYTMTSYTPTTPLEEGKTYYWTILPRDMFENGSCDSGVWSFEVNTSVTNQPPIVFLVSPQDNQTVETVTGTVQLRWKGNDPDGDNITYTLFLGTNMTLVDGFDITVQEQADLTAESYDATGLTNDTVYYWTVRPYDDELTGICLNLTWKFKVMIVEEVIPPLPPDAIFRLDTSLKDDLEASDLSTDIKDTFNTEGFPLTVDAVLAQDNGDWKITDGENIYNIKEEDGQLNVYKTTAPEPPKEDDDDEGLDMVLVAVLVLVVIIIIVLLIVMMVFSKKKKPEEAAPVEEREEIPPPGEVPMAVPAVEAGEGEPAAEGEAPAEGVSEEELPEGVPVEEGAPEAEQPPAEGDEAAVAAPVAAAPTVEGEEPAAEAPPVDETTAKVVAAPTVAAAPTVVEAPTPVPTPVVEELPVLDSKPTACPQCSAENMEFGDDNTGKCVVCDYQFKWNE